MTSDQMAQMEQIESHAQALRTDLEAAKAKKPSQHLEMALIHLADVVYWAKAGILRSALVDD